MFYFSFECVARVLGIGWNEHMKCVFHVWEGRESHNHVESARLGSEPQSATIPFVGVFFHTSQRVHSKCMCELCEYILIACAHIHIEIYIMSYHVSCCELYVGKKCDFVGGKV